MQHSIEASTPPWQNCIAVCQKCAGKLNAMDGDKTRLRVALKATIAARDLRQKVRAVDASCFDICPEGRISVLHFTSTATRAITVAKETSAEDILKSFGY